MNHDEIKKHKDHTEHRQNEITQNYLGQWLFRSLFCFKMLQPPFCTPNSSGAISTHGLSRAVGLGEAGCQLRFLTCPLEALAETRWLRCEGANPFLDHQVRSAEDTSPPRLWQAVCLR